MTEDLPNRFTGEPRILIADDQRDVREALRLLFKRQGWDVQTAHSPRIVLELLKLEDFDLILMDLNYARDTTSGIEGLDLLEQVIRIDATLPVVVITAWGSVELAVEAMRRGARDFIQKPWDNARVLAVARVQRELRQALRRGRHLEAENGLLRGEGKPVLVAESRAMKKILETLAQIAPSDANVLITGEHGTGKGLLARWLHSKSNRNEKPFVTVNTGGLSETLFGSELFGHVRGAFTDAKSERIGRFELAHGGTLFLDEIANVPMSQQPKLLHVLETREFERIGSSKTFRVDVRVVAATNADLPKEVEEGRFRADLLFRLNTIQVEIPPLRDRPEDILVLAQYFLEQLSRRYEKLIHSLDERAARLLTEYEWPGNVRELNHVIERAVLLGRGKQVHAADLGLANRRSNQLDFQDLRLEVMEQELIRKTLEKFEGNISKAAEALGISRSALYRRIEKHKL